MRRGYVIALVVALLVVAGLWLAARLEKSPLGRDKARSRVPEVVAGRDRVGPRDEAEEDDEPFRPTEDAGFIRCRYEGEDAAGGLTAMGESVVTGDASGSELSLRLPVGTWSVLWQTDHGALPLGSVDVEAGDVLTCGLSEEGWRVSGTVRNLQGTPIADAGVTVCGRRTRADGDGRFTGHSRRATCSVQASYRDGVLQRRSEAVEVGPFDATDVELSVDDAPIAGMGISFRLRGGAAVVLAVTPDSPAEAAGVETGDRIVKVDGTSVDGLTDDAFIALGTGKEGSWVRLEIERDGETVNLGFTRRRIEAAKDTGK